MDQAFISAFRVVEPSEILPRGFVEEEIVRSLGATVRRIGARATPEVLAHQLVIDRLRSSADLTRPEELALKVFSAVLLELDRLAAEEQARIAAEAATPPERRPVPIDETTMELTDGPFDTWGGKS